MGKRKMRGIVSAMMFAVILTSTLGSAFNVGLVHAQAEVMYIHSDGSVSPSSAPISSVDNVTYTFTGNMTYPACNGIVVEKSNIVIDGNGYTVQGNYSGTLSGQSTGLYLNGTNNVTIRNANIEDFLDGIYLSGSNNSIISGNNVTANYYGINVNSSSNNTVSGNTATANGYGGIWLHFSSNKNIISRNNVANSLSGIGLFQSSGNIVRDNNVTANRDVGEAIGSGIDIESSSNNTISGNNVTANSEGIYIDFSSNNIVSGNNVTANSDVGIWIDRLSKNNTVNWNNVTANSIGIWLYYFSDNNSVCGNNVTANGHGIWLHSSSNNTVYDNNFVGNVVQASVDSESLGNAWSGTYPSGGNYWSDYNGTDLKSGQYQNVTGSDGIGDTQYVVDANNTDDYPLMGVFSDFNVAGGVDVQVVSNSTISDFRFNGTAILFNVSGTNGTIGFCNVRVPTDLLNGTLKVFVNGTQVQYSIMSVANSSINCLHFAYSHSIEQVTIIPEFPDSLLLTMLILATLLLVLLSVHISHNRARP